MGGCSIDSSESHNDSLNSTATTIHMSECASSTMTSSSMDTSPASTRTASPALAAAVSPAYSIGQENQVLSAIDEEKAIEEVKEELLFKVEKPRKKRRSLNDVYAFLPRKTTRLHNNGEQNELQNFFSCSSGTRTVCAPLGVSRVAFVKEGKRKKGASLLDIRMVHPGRKKSESKLAQPHQFLVRQVTKTYARKMQMADVEDEIYLRGKDGREAEKDRDELVWKPSDNTDDEEQQLDEALEAASRLLPIDVVLNRLMKNGYNVNRMLNGLEDERKTLPQSIPLPDAPTIKRLIELWRELSMNGQIQLMMKIREVQDQLLPSYFLGEIVTLYHYVRSHVCPDDPKTLCACTFRHPPSTSLSRVQCHQCTYSLWPERALQASTPVLCRLCELYKERTGEQRVCGILDDVEIEVVEMWKSMQAEGSRQYTAVEVVEQLLAIKECQEDVDGAGLLRRILPVGYAPSCRHAPPPPPSLSIPSSLLLSTPAPLEVHLDESPADDHDVEHLQHSSTVSPTSPTSSSILNNNHPAYPIPTALYYDWTMYLPKTVG